MVMCIAEGKKFNDSLMSVLENNLVVNLVGILLKHKVTGCGTMGPNRGILKDLEKVTKQLKRGQSFRRKGDVLMQVWKDRKRLV
jgi:hypothetical protein